MYKILSKVIDIYPDNQTFNCQIIIKSRNLPILLVMCAYLSIFAIFSFNLDGDEALAALTLIKIRAQIIASRTAD